MKSFLALTLCLCLSAAHQSLAQPYPFPTEAKKLGSAGTPGDLDRESKSFLGGPFSVRFLDNPPDIRTAMVQTDGKILIGGTFRLQASGVTYAINGATESFTVTVVWRNLARLNADGTLDTNFISPEALNVAKATGRGSVVYGPDGAVYSILVESNDDLYQYLIAGDFLNFSHNQLGNPAPRKRYLTLQTFDPNPNLTPIPAPGTITVANSLERINLRDPNNPTRPARVGTIVFQQDNGVTYRKVAAGYGGSTQPGMPGSDNWQAIPPPPLPSEPLVSLTLNVADGDGFDGPVRKLRRLFGAVVSPDRLVPNTPARLALLVPIGTRVLQTDNGFIYEKISGASNLPTDPVDWVVLPGGRERLYFATGDFTRFVNDPDARYITRFILNPGGITLPSPFSQWTSTPQPDKRVWDVTAIGAKIFFVGDFDTLGGGQINWRKIAAISQNGTIDATFDPGAGFNASAMSIVADPIQNNVVVAGYFTDYDGNPVGRIARVNPDGSMVPSFPAPNEGNAEGANGPIRCVTRQPDGRLIIAGEFTSYNGIKRSGVARLEADGSLDLTFVPQGIASGIQNFAFDMDGGPATASLFARPIAVGNFSKLFGSPFTGVARFIGGSFPVIWYQPNKVNPPFAITLGDDKRLAVVATDNFVGFPGIFGVNVIPDDVVPDEPARLALLVPIGFRVFQSDNKFIYEKISGVSNLPTVSGNWITTPPSQEPPFVTIQAPSEPLLYQWQKNGKDIQGQVLSYLDIEDFEPSDAGRYTVQVWNSHFRVESEPVNLAVRNPFSDVLPEGGLVASGLIEPNETLNGGLGGSIQFSMSRTGMVSGTITLGNPGGRLVTTRFSGQYNYETGLAIQIPRANQSALTLRLQANFSSVDTATPPAQRVFEFTGPENFLGDSFATQAFLTASNIPWSKSNPATPYAGTYNVGLVTDSADLDEMVGPPDMRQPEVSQGFGFFTMRVLPANGQARLSGMLADGTKFTAASAVRADVDGTIPLWVALYSAQGSLAGTLSIATEAGPDGKLPPDAVNEVLAELTWNKPPAVPRSPDAAGFSGVLLNSADGSGLYAPALASGSLAVTVDLSDGAWQGLSGSLTGGPVIMPFNVTNGKGKPDGDNPNAVTFGFAPKTGLLSGTFVNPDALGRPRRISYRGITLTGTGSPSFLGFFIMPNLAVKSPDFYIGGSMIGN